MLSTNQSQLRADLELLRRAPGKLVSVLPNLFLTQSLNLGCWSGWWAAYSFVHADFKKVRYGEWTLSVWPVCVESRIIWTRFWRVFTHGKLES